MLSLVLLTMFGANPMKVIAPDWEFTGIAREEGALFQERFLALVRARPGLGLLTRKDIERSLETVRRQQLLGCESASDECMAELSDALGVDSTLTGTIGKSGSQYVVTLQASNAKSTRPFATATSRLDSSEAVMVWLEKEAGGFADRTKDSFDTFISERNRVTYSYRAFPWVVLGGGALSAALGAIAFGHSRGILTELRRPGPANDEAQLVQSGQLFQDGGVGLMIAGGAVMGAAVGLLFLTREAQPRLALLPMPGGAAVSVGGAW